MMRSALLPALVHRRSLLLLTAALLVLLLSACAAGRTVSFKHAAEPLADGTREYVVEASGTGVAPDGRFARTALADDPWVRHCFEPAEIGSGIPYYCVAGRTAQQAWLEFLSTLVAVAVTWLVLGRAVAWRVPVRAAVPEAPRDEWLFARTEAEKRAHAPIGRTHWRMVTTHYGLRAAFTGALAAALVTTLAATLVSRWAAEWALGAGIMHLIVFGPVYGWHLWRSAHLDEVRHARLLFAVGVGFGLLVAGFVLTPWESVGL